MKYYKCESCNMEIKPCVCNKCNQELTDNVINKEGKDIRVAKCPTCHNMIKSPQCCGHDMKSC